MNFAQLDSIKALFWSAVISGVVAVPLPLWEMGWLCTAAMAFAVVMRFATW